MQIVIMYKSCVSNLLIDSRLFFSRNQFQHHAIIPYALSIWLQGFVLLCHDIKTAPAAAELKSAIRHLFYCNR